MKACAIVYTSNTGYTRQYAEMLGEKTGLPVYSLKEVKKELSSDSSVIYLGWLMAGRVQGFAKAAKRFNVEAVCGVGMGSAGSQTEDIRKANPIPETVKVFTLQGGFDMNKLHGMYKLMMTMMSKTLGKSIAEKNDRTAEEEDMLDLLTKGGNRVSEENLDPVLNWYNGLT